MTVIADPAAQGVHIGVERDTTMNITVYCPVNYRREVEAALGKPSTFFSEWSAFEQSVRRADVLIVLIEDLAGAPEVAAVARLHGRNPGAGTVLLTDAEPENVMLVPHVRCDELVLLNRLDERLPLAVVRAANRLRIKLRDGVVASPLSPWLKRALLIVVDADPPIRSVAAWSERTACVPGALRYHFVRESFASWEVTPGDFLDVNLLLFALERMPTAKSWHALGRAVRIDRRRLMRVARRIVPRWKGSPRSLTAACCSPPWSAGCSAVGNGEVDDVRGRWCPGSSLPLLSRGAGWSALPGAYGSVQGIGKAPPRSTVQHPFDRWPPGSRQGGRLTPGIEPKTVVTFDV